MSRHIFTGGIRTGRFTTSITLLGDLPPEYESPLHKQLWENAAPDPEGESTENAAFLKAVDEVMATPPPKPSKICPHGVPITHARHCVRCTNEVNA